VVASASNWSSKLADEPFATLSVALRKPVPMAVKRIGRVKRAPGSIIWVGLVTEKALASSPVSVKGPRAMGRVPLFTKVICRITLLPVAIRPKMTPSPLCMADPDSSSTAKLCWPKPWPVRVMSKLASSASSERMRSVACRVPMPVGRKLI
jgi:hypothetical protein